MRTASFTRRVARRLAISVSALALGAAQAQDARSLTVDLGGAQVIELVHVPAGTFEQGSPATELQRGADETQRTVTLTRPFFLGKYPVTRGQFERFIAATGMRTEAERGTSGGFGWDGSQFVQRKQYTWKDPGFAQTDEDPVTLVSYNDALAFLAWLSWKSGRNFALPTEAQWEYACRAGSKTAYPNGDDPARLGAIAWFRGNSGDGTRAVGEKALNAWGLGDMTGSVWEWCEDWYAPYGDSPATDPVHTEPNLPDKPSRVLRGGSWARDAASARSATRHRNDPASRNAENGFRVMTFDPAPPPSAAPQTPAPVPGARNPQPLPPVEAAHPPGPSHPSPVDQPSGGSGMTGVAFLLAVVGVFAVLAIRALRRLLSGGGIGLTRPSTENPYRGSSVRLSTRIVDDGFWIESFELPDGTVLDCRYVRGSRPHHESVRYRDGPRGQFVFTGCRPTSVAVTVHPGSIPPTLADSAAAMGLGMQSPGDEPPEETQRPFRGHPPAD